MSLRYVLLLQRDLQKALRFYGEGLGLPVRVATERWAELAAGPSTLALKAADGCRRARRLKAVAALAGLGSALDRRTLGAGTAQPGNAPHAAPLAPSCLAHAPACCACAAGRPTARRATRRCWRLMWRICRTR